MGKPLTVHTVLTVTAALFLAGLVFLAAEVHSATLTPLAEADFYVQPGQETTIRLSAQDLAQGTTRLHCLVSGYWGKTLTETQATVSQDGTVEVLMTHDSPGYFEITFPDVEQTFGVVCMDEVKGPADEFFCIDAGLSWVGLDVEAAGSMMSILGRRGIAMLRERLSWPVVNPYKDTWQLGPDSRYSQVRDLYPTSGLKTLEVFHLAPDYTRPEPFPRELVATKDAWVVMAQRWRETWGALEVWNEPNCCAQPGDRYVPLAKALSWAVAQAELQETPVVGGCFNPGASQFFLDTCAENGLLDVSDAISFHLYGSPETMQPYVTSYRNWLAHYGKPTMPLWVSESGFAWQHNPKRRPPASEDNGSAVTTTMRGIEGRVCGLKRYFAFFLAPHQEGPLEWGMTGPQFTPLRSMATWLQAARVLAHKAYLGDLKHDEPGISRARVFGDAGDVVVVLYGSPPAGVKLNVPVRRIEGADGRVLEQGEGGVVPMPDGLTYAWIDVETVRDYLIADAETMRLYQLGQAPPSGRKSRPIALQSVIDSNVVVRSSEFGYVLATDTARECQVGAKANNFSDQAQTLQIALDLPAGATLLKGDEQQTVNVPGQGTVDLAWTMDLSGVLMAEHKASVAVRAMDLSGRQLDRILIPFRPTTPKTVYVVPHRRAPVTVDGKVDPGEWDGIPAVADLTCVAGSGVDVSSVTAADLSARARFQWDQDHLYYLVEVNDQEHVQTQKPALSWQEDSLQMAINQENSELDRNQFEWAFFLDSEGAKLIAFTASTGDPLSQASPFAIVRDDTAKRTVYEGALAWADLGSMKVVLTKEGMRFGLTFLVNDSDGGTRKWVEWSPGIGNTKDTRDFPELILGSTDNDPIVRDTFSDGDYVADPQWTMEDPNPATVDWCVAREGENPHLEAIEAEGARLWVDLGELQPDTPVSATLLLSTKGWTGQGYEFRMSLYDSRRKIGYTAWCAPGDMYGDRSGFAIAEYSGNRPTLGEGGEHLIAGVGAQKLTFTYDPLTEILTLACGPVGGAQKVVASCAGRQDLSTIDRFEIYTPSTWGAPPRIVDDVLITGTMAANAQDRE